MLYSGESFSTSHPGLCSICLLRPLLNAAVMPMLLSKELSASSDGYGFSFSWSLVWCGLNCWHHTKDPVCPAGDRWWYLLFIQRIVCHHSPVSLYGEEFSFLSIIFPVQVWQWRILTIKIKTLCVKSNIINFYIFVIQIILTKETWSLFYSGFLWFAFLKTFAYKCDIISHGFIC